MLRAASLWCAARRLAASPSRSAVLSALLLFSVCGAAAPTKLQPAAQCEALLDQGRALDALQAVQTKQGTAPAAQVHAALLCAATAQRRLGDLAQALESLQGATELARQLNDPKALASSLLELGDLHVLQNRHDLAFPPLEEAYEIARQQQLRELEQLTLNSLATVYYATGRLELAERYYRELADWAEQAGSEQDRSIAQFNLAHALASQEKFAEADQAFERARELGEAAQDRLGTAFVLKAWAESARAQGQQAVARERFAQALAIFRQAGEAKQYATTLRHLGDQALDLGEYAAAVEHYQEAAPILKQHGFRLALLRTYRGMADAYGLLEDFSQAYRYHRAYTILLQEELEQEKAQTMQRLQTEFETQRLADSNQLLAVQNASQQEQIDSDRQLKYALAGLVSLALLVVALLVIMWLNLRRHAARMEKLATRDELTGLRNRRAIMEFADSEWQRATRFERPLSCLLFDIDHFKSVNDTYGHPTGDQVLRTVAQDVAGAIRTSDAIGRFGGEEFIVFASETTQQQALALGERIRAAVAATTYQSMPGRQITVSIGVAEHCHADSLEQLIAQADEALYVAKQSGRNRVHASAPPAPDVAGAPTLQLVD